MDAEGGTGEVSRRACISGTDGSACCLPDVLAGNVVLKGLRLINRAYREDIVISSASPIHSEGMGGVIDSDIYIGTALIEHLRSLDLQAVNYRRISGISYEQIRDISDAVQGIFDFQPCSI